VKKVNPNINAICHIDGNILRRRTFCIKETFLQYQVHAKIKVLGVPFSHLLIAIMILLDWKSQISAKNPVEFALVRLPWRFNLVNLHHVEKVTLDALFVSAVLFSREFGWYLRATRVITRYTSVVSIHDSEKKAISNRTHFFTCDCCEIEIKKKFTVMSCHSSVVFRFVFTSQDWYYETKYHFCSFCSNTDNVDFSIMVVWRNHSLPRLNVRSCT